MKNENFPHQYGCSHRISYIKITELVIPGKSSLVLHSNVFVFIQDELSPFTRYGMHIFKKDENVQEVTLPVSYANFTSKFPPRRNLNNILLQTVFWVVTTVQLNRLYWATKILFVGKKCWYKLFCKWQSKFTPVCLTWSCVMFKFYRWQWIRKTK